MLLGLHKAVPDPTLDQILEGVSRSFYLSLAILPQEIRTHFSVAYLIARAADTRTCGLASSRRVTQSDRPDKQLYRVSSDGRRALKRWLGTIEPGAPRGGRTRVHALSLGRGRLAVGGDFTTLGGLPRAQLGLITVTPGGPLVSTLADR